MKKLTHGTLAATLAVVVMAGAAVAAPTVSITSPANGTTVSRSQTPTLALAGAVNFDTPASVDAKYYLRQNVCSNATTDVRSLAPTFSNADAASCGYNGNITPLNEVVQIVDGVPGLVLDYSLQDQFLPVTLDATKPITGNLRLASFNANGVGVGVGVTTVDVTVRGTVNGSEQTVGSASVSYQHLPGTVNKDLAFSITPGAALDKKDLTTLTLDVYIHGVNLAHGWLFFRGLSHVTVPSYTASFDRKVQVAVDNGSFSSAGVTLGADLTTWGGSIATPSAGFTHAIKARAVQGSVVSAPTEVAVTVTS
jgi:hypothetical protein